MCDRIRQARRRAALTQAQLADALRVAPSAVAQWESAAGTAPRVDRLAQVALALGVHFEWLATGRGPSRSDGTEESHAVSPDSFARDLLEERLLAGFRRIPRRKRAAAVRSIENWPE